MTDARNAKLDHIFAQARPQIAAHWRECQDAGLEDATPEACAAADAAIARYFTDLKALPAQADDDAILARMKTLYAALDEVNEAADDGLLEADERELLAPIFIAAAEAAGIDPKKYDGEPGGEFRNF